ncbi:hypothetical protein M0D21_07805 [Aquimarina sp. D1M17]|uniref:hypothetical protein n=1 Tax=Aquimarina acroporae TaxID=2937283 RepID=UPI0020C048B2|nr:hypothetical protein [Aquimarina acroporae]MCK8521467.1 hypothetical protein [Aquimarina acroporae]
MTKTLQIICVFIFSSCSLTNAQQNEQGDYIVLKTGETLYGSVSYINEKAVNRGFHKKIRLTNAKGKTKKYKRENITMFRVNGVNYQSFWLSQPRQSFPPSSLVNPRYNIDFRNGKLYFLKVISTGKLSHYELEWFDQGDSQLWSMTLLKKANDNYFIRANQGILGLKKKVLRRYFADCYELQQSIQNSEIKKVWQVVEAYNNNCN